MRHVVWSLLLAGGALMASAEEPAVRLITLDPGHFHAGLIQREMYPGVDPTVHVYAPLGPDLLAHLGRVSAFNRRAEKPTSWRLEVHAGPDFLERMLREKPGNVVVLSAATAARWTASSRPSRRPPRAGGQALADLRRRLPEARAGARPGGGEGPRRLRRHDRALRDHHDPPGELARDPQVAGTVGPGTRAEPAVEMVSVHHLMKVVAAR